MIALRGTLERKKKQSAEGGQNKNNVQQQSPSFSSSSLSKPNEPENEEEWIWQGYWAFGLKLPSDKRKWQKFMYKWEQPIPPENVLVVSLNYADDDDNDANDNENNENNIQETQGVDKRNHDQPPPVETITKDGEENKSRKESEEKSATVDAKKNESQVESATSKESTKSDADATTNPMEIGTANEFPVVGTATATTQSMDLETKQATKQDTKPSTSRPTPMEIDGTVATTTAPSNNDATTTASSGDKTAAESDAKPTVKPAATSKPQPPKPPKITFATKLSDDDPPYTDASTKHPDKCPPGGRWRGYFENSSKPPKPKKNNPPVPPQIQQIVEEFKIYLNATPPPDAQPCFPTEESPKKKKGGGGGASSNSSNNNSSGSVTNNKNTLQKGQFHARGTGQNQFGTFELMGSFDPVTRILECQRMYVTNLEKPKATTTTTPQRRRSSAAQGLTEGAALAGTAAKSGTSDGGRYFTRKRPISWKKRSPFGGNDSDDDNDDNNTSTPARRKGNVPGGSGLVGVAVGGKRVRLTEPSTAGQVTAAVSPKPGIPGGGGAPRTGLSITIPPVASKKPAPSPRGTPRNKKGTSPKESKQSSFLPPPSSNMYMKLPAVGDPKQAHWRAAHYLYYQKNDPTQEEGASTDRTGGTPAAGNAYKYVVYEGEMLKAQREGRGVCLYNNQMIYEGEWQRNKEHGRGTLITADRKRVIYQGEWERGRMHGKGVFYYESEGGISDDGKGKKKSSAVSGTGADDVQSRYEGDFRENLRHGNGIYVLQDGSVYEGTWREGMMHGRGVFNWSDGSVYEGEWKDGRRHGAGVLRASDGFSYDGMWVQNAMEGRGTAVYPNGQTYNGLFSNGKREGRGTIYFTNGAVYEGRFRDDKVDGQGTMKILKSTTVSRKKPAKQDSTQPGNETNGEGEEALTQQEEEIKPDFLIPLFFQSDMGHIHQKAGFTQSGG